MNGYNFTERVRKVLAMSREEAVRLGHEYVGTEHILLGLAREGEGVAAAVLQALNVDPPTLIATIDRLLKKPARRQNVGPDLPYTSRAKKVLELAMTEARELNHSYVGTEHLLLGLIREEKGIAAQVLLDEEVTVAVARAEVLRLLGTDVPRRDLGGAERPIRVDDVTAAGDANAERGAGRSPRRAKSLLLADWATDRARTVIGRARA